MKFGQTRREVCVGLGAAALTGLGLRPRGAAAQDNPDDCAPIGVDGKTPVPYKTDSKLPVRVRKSAFELDKHEVDRLKEAFAALRKLTQEHPEDPRGWLRGSYVHCWYCGGGTDNQAGEEIHGSWLFFPWHRCYLHFYERILCRLIKDDTFALPYWDWDSTGRQVFPSIYGDPTDSSNPLSDMLRSAKAGAAISSRVVSTAIMNKTMNASTNNLFMGTASHFAGAMENSPHGPVHIWTADVELQAANNDMGVLATAARDPVFFAHHGNIDRLWGVWLDLAPEQHKNFTSTAWTQHAWQFYNEDAVWTQITIADVLDPVKSLRSEYAKPTPKPIWTYKPTRRTLLTAQLEERPVAAATLTSEKAAAAPIAIGKAPITREIELPEAESRALAQLNASTPARYVLYVSGIEVPKDGQAMFNVFLNLPDATAATGADSPNFVGTVTVLAKTKSLRALAPVATNAAFDVTDVLSEVKGTGPISVTLVPIAGEGAGPSAPQATFKQLSIERF